MKITVEIPNKLILDCVYSARIAYWAKNVAWSVRYNLPHIRLYQNDVDTPPLLELDRAAFEHGLTLMATKHPRHFGDLMGGKGDSITGDILIQLAAFGEVVYG